MKSQNKNKRKVFINTFQITLGSILEKIFFFVITVLIARYLTVDQYGEYTTALGLASFFALFSNLNMNIPIIKAISQNKKNQNEYFTGTLLVKSFLSIIVYILLIITLQLTSYNKNIILLTLILGLMRIGSELIFTLYSFFEAREKFNYVTLMISAFSSSFLIGTAVIILLEGNYFAFAFLRLFITLFFLMIIFIIIKKFYSIKFNLEIVIDFIKSLIPFSGSFVAQNIASNYGIILLPLMHDTIYTGIYQNAYLVLTSVSLMHLNLLRVLVPFLYKYSFNKDKDKFQFSYDIYSKIFGVLAFYLLIIFYNYSEPILLLIFGTKYNSSVPILKLLVCTLPFISVAPTIITTLNKQKINTLFDTISTIFYMLISIIMIYYLKAEGVALSYLLTTILGYVLSNGYLSKKKYVEYTNILKNQIKLLLFLMLIYLFHVLISLKLHFFILIGIDSLIYVLLVFCFILKKDDIRIIKELLNSSNS